jgi:excisionase family DNA binding protein
LLVSAHQAARLLGIGRTTLYELIKQQRLTPVHIGRCARFSVTGLEHYVRHLVVGTYDDEPQPDPSPATKAGRRVSTANSTTPTLF